VCVLDVYILYIYIYVCVCVCVCEIYFPLRLSVKTRNFLLEQSSATLSVTSLILTR